MTAEDHGALWHMEVDFGTSRATVRMAERDRRAGILVHLEADGGKPVRFHLTPDQAGWLGDALPAALAMLRSWQEQRDWEISLHDPFADFESADPDGSEAAVGDLSNPSDAPAPADSSSSERASGSVSDVEDIPVPQRRGQAWSAREETQLTEAFQAGQGVEQLGRLLQRSPRAIRKRLEKLELVVADR